MKVLLYCPLNPKTPYIFGRTNQSIFRQDYEPLEIMFSKGDNPWFDSNGRHNIAHNYNKARRFALDNGFDYLLTVEADMVIPSYALTKLLDTSEAQNAGVVYGLYVFKNSATWSAWTYLDMDGGRAINKDPALIHAYWGKTMEVAGVGLGCTLIRRDVLEAIEFRTDELHESVHNDWCFAYDLQQKGFKQVCDLRVVCGHISLKPSPRVIWPDPEMPRFYRNDFIEDLPLNERGELEIEIGQFGEFYVPRSVMDRLMVPVPKDDE